MIDVRRGAGGLLGPSEAARLLGVGPTRLRQLVTEGVLPATMTPLGRLFERADVQRLKAEREARAGAK